MVKIGVIALMSNSGLGVQTRRLCEFLNPSRVMIMDSSEFSRNTDQHPEWYAKYDNFVVNGFPKNYDILRFIDGLTHVFVCENPYNFYLLKVCKERGIKVYIQSNYEFCENTEALHLPTPDLFLMPSYWMIDEMKKKFGENKVQYLPPPIDVKEFLLTWEHNIKRIVRKKRFLHVVGTLAFNDRNGTLNLMEALKYSKGDYELTITSQHPFTSDRYLVRDDRLRFVIGSVKNNCDLYRNFDAMILPRRYGGLCLSLNEALMCGLPTIMPDISPNNKLLPREWLVPAQIRTHMRSRTIIDVYGVNPVDLASKIDEFASMDLTPLKEFSYHLAVNNFSTKVLEPAYNKLWN